MKTRFARVCFLVAIPALLLAAEETVFETDPDSATLRALAESLVVDESRYGCGPLRQPGVTYYVSIEGSDEADGLTPETALRHIRTGVARLRAGDTLMIGEGQYIEQDLVLDAAAGQSGEPGRPITIQAVPRHRVVISTALRPELQRTVQTEYTWEAIVPLAGGNGLLWEADTKIMLQEMAEIATVDELPATWCWDAETGKVHVHFSDSRADVPRPLAVRPGRASVSHFRGGNACIFDVRSSYIHFQGLQFEHDNVCLVVRGNLSRGEDGATTYAGGDHVTVENCAFSSTCFAGLILHSGARWNLIKGNYGTLNGGRGSLLINGADNDDNLLIGNRLEASASTLRTRGWNFHFGISTYGHVGQRNHLVNNIMDDTHSFRSKYMFRETVVQGNVMTGSASTEPCAYEGQRPADLWKGPEDRTIFRNNVLLQGFRTAMQPMPPGGPGSNWADPYKVFVNNFVPDPKNRAEAIATVRFADPAHADYRLQADSPLRGQALGGGDIGAYRESSDRIFYVSSSGDDATPGTSDDTPLRTLAKAAAALRPGDTLYVMPGTYDEALAVAVSGRADAPITIRAHGKQQVLLPRMRIVGSWIVADGFTIPPGDDDGVVVTGHDVTLKHFLVHGRGGCGMRASAAKQLTLLHCTLTGNDRGLVLEGGSIEAQVRDSILAGNRAAQVVVSADSVPGYLASHNCYFGVGTDEIPIGREFGSVIADPLFADSAASDYRLAWNSPAAHLAPFGRAAGVLPALKRVPVIAHIAAAGVSSNSAVITWRTPEDDTTGSVRYRVEGTERWSTLARSILGTVHAVAFTGLKSATAYEFAIRASGRRGGAGESPVQTFATSEVPRAPATYYVAADGDDSADGLTRESAWRTLRQACFLAGAGDTVLVQPGRYHDQFLPLRGGTAEQRLTFRADGDGVVIDGRNVLAPFVQMQAKPYVTFDGFTFVNAPREGGFGAYFDVRSSPGTEILNCRIGAGRPEGGFSTCFFLTSSHDSRVEGNVVWGTRYHIQCSHSRNMLIKNNTFVQGQVFSAHIYGPHDGVRFINNLFYYPTSVPNAALAIAHPDENIQLTSDYNLFGPMRTGTHVAYVFRVPNSDLPIPGPDLEQWQRNSGQDAHSIQADPMFVDPRRGDFRLKNGSPALGAGEGGVNIGACGLAPLSMKGRTSLLPGEGRTVRMEADLVGADMATTAFAWKLPDGSTHEGRILEYTPPADIERFTLRLTSTDADGAVDTAEEAISVPPADFERPGVPLIRIEAEDFVDQGEGNVQFLDLINASGKAITYWSGSVGHWLEWELDVPQDGKYLFYARYTTNLHERSRSFTLNGKSPGEEYEKILFPHTGGWGLTSDTWAYNRFGPALELKAGRHRFRMTNLDSAINVDYFVIVGE